ncbi:MAG: glycosyltransferase [Firmicutes bacterium]|nr:glycosyltransferase [Bacillota bacterium]
MKISACWIVKNEEANLGLSIESVKDLADELIVVDTGSTDGTVALAKSYGAQVQHFTWINDFSAAKNYALSYATGDIIIFLDADELFEPKLGPAEHAKIAGIFSNNPQVVMITSYIQNLRISNHELINVSTNARIFRNMKSLRYRGSVHEYLRPAANELNIRIDDSLNINHYGYSGEVQSGKGVRNLAILEKALQKLKPGEEEHVRLLMYLLRESFNLQKEEKAWACLNELFKYPTMMKKVCQNYDLVFMQTIYAAIVMAYERRDQVSRRDIRTKLFDFTKDVYPKYPGAYEIDVLYQILFDMKEDRFLQEVGPSIQAAAIIEQKEHRYYKKFEWRLCGEAAFAARRRGDGLVAMEYAIKALQGGDKHNRRLLNILLNAIKGQPPTDIVLLLNSIYNAANPDDLENLIEGTTLDGFLEVNAYYLKKRLTEATNIEDNCRFLLICKNFNELAAVAAEAYEAKHNLAAHFLFLAALCGASPFLIKSHEAILTDYIHILEAFYSETQLTQPTEADYSLLEQNYALIACIAGLPAADKFRGVFMADPLRCYAIKARYCEMNSLPQLLLEENTAAITKWNLTCRIHLINAWINVGRYEEALRDIEVLFKMELIRQDLLHMLLVVAEKAQGATAKAARSLYERYMELYDTLVDLTDVINTGIVFDESGKRKKRYFAHMTIEQLDKLVTEETGQLVTGDLLKLQRKAAAVYKEHGLAAEAAHSLIRLVAHKQATEEDRENLAEIFNSIKNNTLADYMADYESSAVNEQNVTDIIASARNTSVAKQEKVINAKDNAFNPEIKTIETALNNCEFQKVADYVELWLKSKKAINGTVYYYYGVSLNALGKYDEALEAHKKAIRLLPKLANMKSTTPIKTVHQYDEYNSDCLGCGCPDTKAVFVCNQSISANNYGVINPIRTWKRCEKCGLIYTGNMPSFTALSKYYSEHFNEIKPGGVNYSISEVGDISGYLKYSENRLQRIEKISDKPGRLLDIGAGLATFVRVAQMRGWHAEGLESSQENVQYAKTKWGIELLPIDFFDYEPTVEYNAVTMFEVIEHLINPWEAIEKCAALLTNKGVLVIATPFRDSEFVKARTPLQDFWWNEPSHLSYLDTQTLIKRTQKAGLSCIDIVESEQGAGRLEVYLQKTE